MKNRLYLLGLATAVMLSYGLYQALMGAPTEATMGPVQRIFYYHVPSAWTGFVCFTVNFVASLMYAIRRRPAADALALSSAEVGVVFTTIVLLTGPIWAKPVWGIWWTWDLRLTTTLVLWLIYVSYLILRRFSTGTQTALTAAALAIFGFLDMPLVYFSIWYFRTQHPKPVIGGGGSLHPAMRYALFVNFAAFLLLAALVISVRYRLARIEQQLEEAHADAALEA